MNLTRKQKDRIITVLKKAKPHLAFNYCFYVCIAVEETDCNQKDKSLTKTYVEEQIYPHYTVVRWLVENYDIRLKGEQAIEYRRHWVDHMIQELSE